MPINWGLVDTQFPQKLSDLFDPNVIQQRQTALSDQSTMNQLRQAQLMQAAQGLQRAPELARREDVAYAQQQEGMQAQQANALRKQKLLEQLNAPNVPPQIKQQIFTQLFPEEAAKQAFKPPEKTPDWKDPSYWGAKREQAKFEAGLKSAAEKPDKVPLGYQVQPDGTLKAWQGGPADIKEQAKSSAQETGRENVSQTIASLRDAYAQLKEGGGITDPNASGISNLTAGAASSGLGQAVGRMFGTQNQSKRNEILMTRPALLQHIMKATGMSAKQMDSNAELKLWLATATDPTLDISANMNALDRIEKTYGIGGAKSSPTTDGAKFLGFE